MNRHECDVCGNVIFDDDVEYQPCEIEDCTGSMVLVPFGFCNTELPTDFEGALAW